MVEYKNSTPPQLASKRLEYNAMERIFQPLLFFIARCSRNELIRHIELLKTENEMLRKRLNVRAVFLKPDERARIIEMMCFTAEHFTWNEPLDPKLFKPEIPEGFKVIEGAPPAS